MKTVRVMTLVVVARCMNMKIHSSFLPNNLQRSLSFYSRGKQHSKIFNVHSARKDRDFDYIDVEVVDQDTKKEGKKSSMGNIIETTKQKISSVLSNVAETIGIKRNTKLDIDTIQSRKSSAELKRLNAEVDSAFANTGLFGGLMKQIVKSVGSTLLEGFGMF